MVDAWVVVAVLYHFALVIGSVALKAVDTTILPKTSAVFDVVLAVRVQPLWQIRAILLQWILHRTMEWVQARWQELQGQDRLHQQPEGLDLAEGMEDNTLVAHPARMLFHLVLVLQLALTLPSTLTLVLLAAPTLLVPSTAGPPKQLSSRQVTVRHQQAPPTTSIPTRARATLLPSSLLASVIFP